MTEKNKEIEIDISELTQSFISYIIDRQSKINSNYSEIISEFIIVNEHDELIQKSLKEIREGSILYLGLNYNIDEIGSLKNKLVLFLDTEILFNLVGYNGEIYRQLAMDFFNQVQSINSKENKIKLKYFSDVKTEIDNFFTSASMIVEGKTDPLDKNIKIAMKSIIAGCNNGVDVEVKKADFYTQLRCRFGILEDEYDEYYDSENKKYNLESADFTDIQEQESWKFISHINKLRKGKVFSNILDSKYLLITNTKNTLNISHEQICEIKKGESDFVSDYALSLDHITNILWYKMGNGFGAKEYPQNVNAVIKARIVLSSMITHQVSEVYECTQEQYKNGKISEEMLASRIIMLRQKPILPEELEGDSIEDSLNFSPEFINRFELEHESNKKELENKTKEINSKDSLLAKKDEQIVAQQGKIAEQDGQLSQQKTQIENQAQQIEIQQRELDEYRLKEKKKQDKRNKRKKTWSIIFSVALKIIIVGAVVLLMIFLQKIIDKDYFDIISNVINCITVIMGIYAFITKDIIKNISKKK